MKAFEVLPHTADIKIRAYGTTYEQLFINVLRGMFLSIEPHFVHDDHRGKTMNCATATSKESVTIQAQDREQLLVDFLSYALYLSDIHNCVYLDMIIKQLHETSIEAIVCGVPIKGFAVVEIKAVTYHELVLTDVGGIKQADVVFDI